MSDVFMRSKPDPRLVNLLDRNIWFDTIAYLPVRDVVPAVPRVNKFFNQEVVWHKWSGRLMWLEMAPGAIDARVFKTLLDDRAPPSQTALIRACEEGAPVAHVSALLAGGGEDESSKPSCANVNAVDRDAQTALHRASYRGNEGIVRALLAANADPNIADRCDWTPLITASYCGHSAVMSLLIESGEDGVGLKFNCANVNHADNIVGSTALIHACRYNLVDCVRVLVNARADITIRDYDGRTALDLARRRDRQDIVRLLESSAHHQ
jgi:hypothetical protein